MNVHIVQLLTMELSSSLGEICGFTHLYIAHHESEFLIAIPFFSCLIAVVCAPVYAPVSPEGAGRRRRRNYGDTELMGDLTLARG